MVTSTRNTTPADFPSASASCRSQNNGMGPELLRKDWNEFVLGHCISGIHLNFSLARLTEAYYSATSSDVQVQRAGYTSHELSGLLDGGIRIGGSTACPPQQRTRRMLFPRPRTPHRGTGTMVDMCNTAPKLAFLQRTRSTGLRCFAEGAERKVEKKNNHGGTSRGEQQQEQEQSCLREMEKTS